MKDGYISLYKKFEQRLTHGGELIIFAWWAFGAVVQGEVDPFGFVIFPKRPINALFVEPNYTRREFLNEDNYLFQ